MNLLRLGHCEGCLWGSFDHRGLEDRQGREYVYRASASAGWGEVVLPLVTEYEAQAMARREQRVVPWNSIIMVISCPGTVCGS